MTLFDVIALLILLASGLVGFLRGAAREVITVVAFLLAVALAVLSLRFTGPIARHTVHPNYLANALAILVVFVIAYAALRLLGSHLTRKIQSAETLGMADRIIGVGFGLIRALVALGVFYLVFNAATPSDRVPHWIKDAAFYPLSASSGHVLMALVPKGSVMASKVAPVLEDAVREGGSDQTPPPSEGQGYDEGSRRRVDELVEKAR